MNFLLEPTNLALLAIAIISGLMLLQPLVMRGNARHVNATEATQMINQKAQVIDVRSEGEFAQGHIKQAKLMPVGELATLLTSSKLKKDKPVLVVCESGMRARRAAAVLHKNEFADIAVLDGGMQTWRTANLPISMGSKG